MSYSILCSDIARILNAAAPEQDALPGDAVGLVVGSPEKRVARVLVCLELTPDVVDQAASTKADLIVVHYPAFEASQPFRSDTPGGALLTRLIRKDIALYVLHSNFETALGGGADRMCRSMGVQDPAVLVKTAFDRCYKLVTCIPVLPENYTGIIRSALGDLGLTEPRFGVGVVGDYSHVCDSVQGYQNFVPMACANPFIGTPGVMESVPVDRFEMIVPESMLAQAVKRLVEIHPYEEVEYDVYPILGERNIRGLGRIGTLAGGTRASDFAASLQEILGTAEIRVYGDTDRIVRTVAVAPGATSDIVQVAADRRADVIVTAEISRRDARYASAAGAVVVEIGLDALEGCFHSFVQEHLEEALGSGIEVCHQAAVRFVTLPSGDSTDSNRDSLKSC